MVMVDRLRKVAHFISVRTTYSTNEVAQVFIREIVRLHGVPKKIVSDKDQKFTSKFWKELFVGLGTELAFSTIIIHRQMIRQIGPVGSWKIF